MKSNRPNYYYHPLPGSRNLVTKPAGSRSKLEALEEAESDERIEAEFEGEGLIKEPAPRAIPAEALREDMEGLEPLGQATFLHLLLLSVGQGANWCRVGMSELGRRTGMSRRRLLRALSELAAAGKIKPLDRDKNGTMYIVYSVHFSQEGPGPEKVEKSGKEPTGKKATFREKPIESPVNEEAFPGTEKVVTIRQIAERFFKMAGRKPDDVEMDEAVGQVTFLLEDGYTREEAMKAVKYLAEKFGTEASISKLPYMVNEALNASE